MKFNRTRKFKTKTTKANAPKNDDVLIVRGIKYNKAKLSKSDKAGLVMILLNDLKNNLK